MKLINVSLYITLFCDEDTEDLFPANFKCKITICSRHYRSCPEFTHLIAESIPFQHRLPIDIAAICGGIYTLCSREVTFLGSTYKII